MDRARRILQETFGFSDFRLSQAQVIERLIVKDENALVLYPTGGGKSLCYQIPALCLDGLTLVISPLIALMKDQVDALRAKGVQAASLDSSQTMEQSSLVKSSIKCGTLKILYVAPERLNNETFIGMMKAVNISLVAVDESHCISQWGTSFRPDYLKIARFVGEFNVKRKELRCLCLTATATSPVVLDICKAFKIDPEEGIFRIPIFRPNLAFIVKVAANLEDKMAQAIPILKERTGPAIVYVTLQAHAEEGARLLRESGLPAKMYHAGMSNENRQSVQEYFMASDNGIVVATIAFGMGIDKNNIRQVIHLYAPKTLENYSQEVGRAGRDGLASTCVMFLSAPDIPALEGFCHGDTCWKTSVHLWLQEVMLRESSNDGTIAFNLFEQTRTYDIKSTTLGILYADLELQEGLVRAVTPYYSVYEFNPKTIQAYQTIYQDERAVAKAIWTCTRKTKNAEYHYIINVAEAEQQTSFHREELANHLMHWEMEGSIEIKASQVRNRYRILKERPTSREEIEKLTDSLHRRMVEREVEAVARLHSVIKFATDDKCLADALATHFGDLNAVPNHRCGKCTHCIDGMMPRFYMKPEKVGNPSALNIRGVLDACPDRDDPLFLARIAFGISSPRITMSKLSKNHVFGSLAGEDWSMLVMAFEKACEEGEWKKVTSSESSVTSGAKRKQAGSTSTSHGRGAKRRRGG